MSTTTKSGNIIQVTNPNLSADWTLTAAGYPDLNSLEPGIPVTYMMYTPGASRDVVVIKDRTDAGPQIVKFECANSWDQRIVYFEGRRMKPMIDISAGTYGKKSGSILTICFE